MGWNEARVSLIPRGWKPVIENFESARTASGRPMRIVRMEPVEGAWRDISLQEFREWLDQNGIARARSTSGSNSMNMRDIEVDAFSPSDERGISEVVLTFRLNSNSVSHLGEWASLIARLYENWNLALLDVEVQGTVAREDFPRLLANNASWKQFSEAYGWNSIIESTATHALVPIQQTLDEEDIELAAAMLPEVAETWPLNEAA